MSVERRPRIEVEVFTDATVRQRRELGAFARYCIGRIERDIGVARAWSVKLITDKDIFACTVLVVDDTGTAVRATRSSPDPTLAIWDAMCKVELLVLETRQPA